MASRRVRLYGGEPVVSVFEYDEVAAKKDVAIREIGDLVKGASEKISNLWLPRWPRLQASAG